MSCRGPAADEDGFRTQVDAVGIGNMHPAIHLEERHPLAVNGNLDLFRSVESVERTRSGSHDRAGGLVVERHAEAVLAIRRKHMLHGDSAAGAVGRPFDMINLRRPAGNMVAGLNGGGLRIPYRESADFARRPQIRIHQRRRQQLHIRDVVEVRADRVLRQILGPVHRKRQQIPDRRRVLRAVQPLERTPAGVRALHRGPGPTGSRATRPPPPATPRRGAAPPAAASSRAVVSTPSFPPTPAATPPHPRRNPPATCSPSASGRCDTPCSRCGASRCGQPRPPGRSPVRRARPAGPSAGPRRESVLPRTMAAVSRHRRRQRPPTRRSPRKSA